MICVWGRSHPDVTETSVYQGVWAGVTRVTTPRSWGKQQRACHGAGAGGRRRGVNDGAGTSGGGRVVMRKQLVLPPGSAWRRLGGRVARSPWLHAAVLLAAAAPLVVWAGGASNRESFWVNVLAWVVTLLVTLAVGSVAVPAYRARRRSGELRAALTAQHVLLSRVAGRLAEQLNARYDLDRFVLYPVPPGGGPAEMADVTYYRRQAFLMDEGCGDDPVDRLLHQAQQAQRRSQTFQALRFAGAAPGSYWLSEALVHLSRCPVHESFPLLEALDAARLDRVRDLASGEDPIAAASGTVAVAVDQIASARDDVLSTNLSDRRWLESEFEGWLAEADGAPLPSEFGAWMDELDAVARLAREMARLLLLVEARAETGVEHVVRFGDDEDRARTVAVPAAGWAPGESEIEGAVRLEQDTFLPTSREIPKASDRAQEALGAGNLALAQQWAMRSRDAGEPGALRLLAEIDARAVRRDHATTWLLQAHTQGDPLASYQLGKHLEGEFPGDALHWFTIAAELGSSQACWEAAELQRRLGNQEEALGWVDRGLAAGSVPCLLDAARSAASSDPDRARELARAAARTGSVEAVALLVPLLADSEAAQDAAELGYWQAALTAVQQRPLEPGESLLVPPGPLSGSTRVVRGRLYDSNPIMGEILRRIASGAYDRTEPSFDEPDNPPSEDVPDETQ
jgi:hypothetical protein